MRSTEKKSCSLGNSVARRRPEEQLLQDTDSVLIMSAVMDSGKQQFYRFVLTPSFNKTYKK